MRLRQRISHRRCPVSVALGRFCREERGTSLPEGLCLSFGRAAADVAEEGAAPGTKSRALRINMKGKVEHRLQAVALVQAAGSAVLVERGVLRSLVVGCPDDGGDVLTLNL